MPITGPIAPADVYWAQFIFLFPAINPIYLFYLFFILGSKQDSY